MANLELYKIFVEVVLFSRVKGMELTEEGKMLFKEVSAQIEQLVDVDRKWLDKYLATKLK